MGKHDLKFTWKTTRLFRIRIQKTESTQNKIVGKIYYGQITKKKIEKQTPQICINVFKIERNFRLLLIGIMVSSIMVVSDC